MRGRYFNLSLANLLYRLRKFDDIVRTELEDVMAGVEPSIIKAIQTQLYAYGMNGNDEFIADYQPYKPRTIKNKKRKGQPTDRVTLRDTGEFYRSLYLKRIGGGFAIMSKDNSTKVNNLLRKYKPSILRLSRQALNEIIHEEIRPELVRRLKQKLHED